MNLTLNKATFLFFIATSLFAKNINYAMSDIHTLTIPKNSLHLTASYMLINDSIDLLNVKQSEFGGSSKFNALGDMNGYEFGLAYGLTDNFMISYKINQQKISYSNNDFENTKNEIFARYNVFQNASAIFNNGVSWMQDL